MANNPALKLSGLSEGIPALTPATGTALAEAASVCLESQGHGLRPEMTVQPSDEKYTVIRRPVTDRMKRTHADPQDATEAGAVGVAILLIREQIGQMVIERSRKSTGIDYWMGESTDEPPFQNKSRLEVSGILNGDQTAVRARVRQKLNQTKASDRTQLPAYVVVVEFGEPQAEVAQR